MLTVYVSNICPYCHKLKQWLNSNQISYNLKNIEIDKYSRELDELNGRVIPFSVVMEDNQTTKIAGFNKAAFKKLFSIEERDEKDGR